MRGEAKERALAAALLLPPFVLAWPGPLSLLRRDFLPHATGAGAVALATLPAIVLLVLRPDASGARGVRGLPLLLLPLLCAAAWAAFGRVSDPFEARRAVLGWTTALALALCGASLGEAGARAYVRGLVVLALVLLAFALANPANGFAGALGNTGSLAQAALPGAIAGACLTSQAPRSWGIAGALALVGFLAYTARAPVIAGGLALAAGLFAFAIARPDLTRALRGLYLAAAVLAALGVLAPSVVRRTGTARAAEPPTPASSGGFEVRARIWTRSLAMLGDHAAFGVGPGQFPASFPAYRDPREIELSTHRRAIAAETEVEHPHEDWLAPALDLGAVAGLAWVAFLGLVAGAGLRAIRSGRGAEEALGAGALALLAYALVHAPLTQEPAASSIAYVVFGAVLSRPGSRRWIPISALALLAAMSPAALAFVRHGRALADLAVPDERDAAGVGRSIDAALEACPDSVLARTLHARLLEEREADPAVVVSAWDRVIEVRPDRVEARMQRALARVRIGEHDGAREDWERALALDPSHPGILANLRVLDLQTGSLETGSRWLDGQDPGPQASFERSKEERARQEEVLADLFEARAHLLWAREHAAAGRFADAVRSYRQCVRVTGDHVDGGARRVRLELAAALAADGREEDARKEVSVLRPNAPDLERLPEWAAARLRSLLPRG